MYSLKFIFFNMEPSLQYGSITNKRDDNYEKNKENKDRVCASLRDSTL